MMPKPMTLAPLTEQPLVTVIMANYNYGRYIEEAIESVLAQTYSRLQLIVCDDGSTDESRAVLEGLRDRDARLTILMKENGGQASAWNAAYEHAEGEIVCLLDSDDVYLPNKLESVVATFRQEPLPGLVYHRYQPTTSDGAPVGAPFPRHLESGWLADVALARGGWGPNTVTSVLALRREVAELLFPIPPGVGGFGDAVLQGVSQLLVHIAALPDAFTRYRIHGANLVGTFRPTVRDIQVMADAQRNTFGYIRGTVERVLGPAVAARLRLEDISSYWDYLAALYVIRGKPRDGVHGYSADTVLEHLPDTPRRKIWQGLFMLPSPLGRSLFRMWWSKAWWKRFTRPLTARLGLG